MKYLFLITTILIVVALFVSSCSSYSNAQTVNCPSTENLSGFN